MNALGIIVDEYAVYRVYIIYFAHFYYTTAKKERYQSSCTAEKDTISFYESLLIYWPDFAFCNQELRSLSHRVIVDGMAGQYIIREAVIRSS